MGLIRTIFAPWIAAREVRTYHQELGNLLRELMAVARIQAETTMVIQGTLQQIGMLYITSEVPESWTNDEDGKLMAEMLQRMALEEEMKGH